LRPLLRLGIAKFELERQESAAYRSTKNAAEPVLVNDEQPAIPGALHLHQRIEGIG